MDDIDKLLNKDGTWKTQDPFKVTDSFDIWIRPIGAWLSEEEPQDQWDPQLGLDEFNLWIMTQGRAKQRRFPPEVYEGLDLAAISKKVRRDPKDVWRALVGKGTDVAIEELDNTVKDLDRVKKDFDGLQRGVLYLNFLTATPSYLIKPKATIPKVELEIHVGKDKAISKTFSSGLDGLYEALEWIIANESRITTRYGLPNYTSKGKPRIADIAIEYIQDLITKYTDKSSDTINRIGAKSGLETARGTKFDAKKIAKTIDDGSADWNKKLKTKKEVDPTLDFSKIKPGPKPGDWWK